MFSVEEADHTAPCWPGLLSENAENGNQLKAEGRPARRTDPVLVPDLGGAQLMSRSLAETSDGSPDAVRGERKWEETAEMGRERRGTFRNRWRQMIVQEENEITTRARKVKSLFGGEEWDGHDEMGSGEEDK